MYRCLRLKIHADQLDDTHHVTGIMVITVAFFTIIIFSKIEILDCGCNFELAYLLYSPHNILTMNRNA